MEHAVYDGIQQGQPVKITFYLTLLFDLYYEIRRIGWYGVRDSVSGPTVDNVVFILLTEFI